MLDLTSPDDVVAVVSPRSIVEPLFDRPTTITARNHQPADGPQGGLRC
jgi:hypothetical protein